MTDQASELRRLMAAHPTGPAGPVHTIAITSGKGGVGKTNIALNLGLAMAEAGARVALLDADLGLSNAQILMGLSPLRDLRDVVLGTCGMEDILMDAPHGLKYIPGASGVAELANMDAAERARLLAGLAGLSQFVETALIDTAPGISDAVIDLAAGADQTLIVTTPEPTSLTDAYASAKVILQRRPGANVSLVINMVESRAHATEVARGFASVTRRFLSVDVPLAGFVCEDARVPEAVRRQQPLLVCHPKSLAAGCIRDLARALLSNPRVQVTSGGCSHALGDMGPAPQR
ncbi:MAG TPA: MinD/ParA family protein [Armatimonadota bacterium]